MDQGEDLGEWRGSLVHAAVALGLAEGVVEGLEQMARRVRGLSAGGG